MVAIFLSDQQGIGLALVINLKKKLPYRLGNLDQTFNGEKKDISLLSSQNVSKCDPVSLFQADFVQYSNTLVRLLVV